MAETLSPALYHFQFFFFFFDNFIFIVVKHRTAWSTVKLNAVIVSYRRVFREATAGKVSATRSTLSVDSPGATPDWPTRVRASLIFPVKIFFFLCLPLITKYKRWDEAATKRLHLTVSCTVAIGSSKCILRVSTPVSMFSIYVFACLPWFLLPVM